MCFFRSLFMVLVFALTVPIVSAKAEEIVNVYSYRQPELIVPLFDRFTKETGIKVRHIFAQEGLIERLAQEGRNSPADLLMSVDTARLLEASDRGLAQPVTSPDILNNVPENLRDKNNQWFGLTMRARVIYAAVARISQDHISYEELAEPKWKGKICTRPGNHPYNLGLIAAMIVHRGEEATRQWLVGLKGNLAFKPSGNDRTQAKSIYAGECDLAIGNTYYVGRMLTNNQEPEQKKWGGSLRILFPSSEAMPTHVNISGMLLTKYAPNKKNAVKLMEFLASDEAQELYASGNFEYPVNPKINPTDLVRSWGHLIPDPVNIEMIARREGAASKLVDEVGFNN